MSVLTGLVKQLPDVYNGRPTAHWYQHCMWASRSLFLSTCPSLACGGEICLDGSRETGQSESHPSPSTRPPSFPPTLDCAVAIGYIAHDVGDVHQVCVRTETAVFVFKKDMSP